MRTLARRGQAHPDPADDLALGRAVAQAQSGDEEAFAVLFRCIQPGLIGYLRGTVRDRAEGVAAVVWQEITRELPRYRGDGRGFRGWTVSIARRQALRDAREHGEAVGAAGSPPKPGAPPSGRLVLDLLAELPRAQAEAVLLRHVVRLEEAAAARVMNRPRWVLRILTRRGLSFLAARLGSNEVKGEVLRAMREAR